MTEELYNKIDKFCNETDWSKYPTYEHALEEFIKGIVAEETNELEKKNETLSQNLDDAMSVENCLKKRNEVLEKENAELRNNGFSVSAMTEQQLKVALEKGEQLEKKIADLKCECRRCVYTDSPCILSDYGKDRNGICEHFKDVFDENAELKADNDARKFAMAMSEKVEKQLRNERNTFLAQNEQYEKDLIDLNEQLTKAKEIIREVVEWATWQGNSKCPSFKSIQEKAEQFLKDLEK